MIQKMMTIMAGSKPSVMVVMVSLCVLVLTMPGVLPAIDVVNNIDTPAL